MHADHVGREEIDGLAEHAGLGLDATHAPANDADAVDHRRVRVGADQRVRIIDTGSVLEHALGEVLEIHLMDDADAGRHDLEGLERLHAPLQELVALAVARKLELEVLGLRLGAAGEINLHGVVNDEIHRHERLDQLRVPAELGHRRAHGREVDEQRHAGEVLQHDARDDKGDFLRALGLGPPARERLHGGLGDAFAVAVAQQGFKDETDGNREARDLVAGLLERGHRVEPVRGTGGGEGL